MGKDKKYKKKNDIHLLKDISYLFLYNKDLLNDEKKCTISNNIKDFKLAIKNNNKDIDSVRDKLIKSCKGTAIDVPKKSFLKEHIEIIFVVLILVSSIKIYFFNNYSIPTGSMQPTLNGIISYPLKELNPSKRKYNAPDDYKYPGFVQRIWEKIWFGRTHINWIAKEDDQIPIRQVQVDNLGNYKSIILLDNKKFLGLVSTTSLRTKKGYVYRTSKPINKVTDLLIQDASSNNPYFLSVKKGDVIAKGYIETGDKIIVNKMIYYWTTPKRGDPFVFNTRNIKGIQKDVDHREGSQTYIKRLVGLPNDDIKIDPPNLIINNKLATEKSINRVASKQGLYDGYTMVKRSKFYDIKIPEKYYMAIGDNTNNSFDSRSWGFVPERNIMGRAFFVFYPFGNNFGKVD